MVYFHSLQSTFTYGPDPCPSTAKRKRAKMSPFHIQISLTAMKSDHPTLNVKQASLSETPQNPTAPVNLLHDCSYI